MAFQPSRLLLAALVAAAARVEHAQAVGIERVDDLPTCFGVWTQKWADQKGAIPDSVMLVLNRTEHALLKEAVLRHECPFGMALPGEVTWPSPPRGLSGDSAPLTTAKVLMVAWSFLPYVVSVYIVTLLIIVRGTRQLWVALWLLIYVVLNELVVKSFLKEARPGTLLEVRTYNGMLAGSCLESCGMPSTHAGITSGLFLLVFLDATFRIQSRPPGAGAGQARYSPPTGTSKRTGAGAEVRKSWVFAKSFCALPWAHQEVLTPPEFVAYVFFWFLVLYPTAMARVVLMDHTPEQVIVGKLIGVVSALAWWRIVRNMQHFYEESVGEMVCCGLIVHNFPLDCPNPLQTQGADEEASNAEEAGSSDDQSDASSPSD
mmetsp:Transcript_53013/g.139918  ORF Transcript_53013/g.139918 Transcript_53013/m.139918 type:complete len:374 (+) Transcript_53013:112-1233(+)